MINIGTGYAGQLMRPNLSYGNSNRFQNGYPQLSYQFQGRLPPVQTMTQWRPYPNHQNALTRMAFNSHQFPGGLNTETKSLLQEMPHENIDASYSLGFQSHASPFGNGFGQRTLPNRQFQQPMTWMAFSNHSPNNPSRTYGNGQQIPDQHSSINAANYLQPFANQRQNVANYNQPLTIPSMTRNSFWRQGLNVNAPLSPNFYHYSHSGMLRPGRGNVPFYSFPNTMYSSNIPGSQPILRNLFSSNLNVPTSPSQGPIYPPNLPSQSSFPSLNVNISPNGAQTLLHSSFSAGNANTNYPNTVKTSVPNTQRSQPETADNQPAEQPTATNPEHSDGIQVSNAPTNTCQALNKGKYIVECRPHPGLRKIVKYFI